MTETATYKELHRSRSDRMLAGVCGGLLATGFAKLAGEPAIDSSIAYEEAHVHGKAASTNPSGSS